MYTFSIVMIVIASILLILAVLVQSPKSGMAANFGAANQTMGVRQTSDFLEKFTWAMVAAIVLFTLLSVTAMPSKDVNEAEVFNPIEASKPEATEAEATLEVPAEAAEVATEEAEAPAAEAEVETPAAEQTTEAAAE